MDFNVHDRETFKKVLTEMKSTMMKIGEIEASVEAMRKLHGEGTSAEDKQEIQNLSQKMNELVGKMEKTEAAETKRMDEMEKEFQEYQKSQRQFVLNATRELDPAAQIHKRLADLAGFEYDGTFTPEQERQVLGVTEKYGSKFIHAGEDTNFRKFIDPNYASKVTVSGLRTDAVGSAGPLQIPRYKEGILDPLQASVGLLSVFPMVSTSKRQTIWFREKISARQGSTGPSIQSLDFTGTGQGTELTATDFQFETQSEETRTFGTIIVVTDQIIMDIDGLRAYLDKQGMYECQYDLLENVLRGTNKVGTTGDQQYQLNSLNAASTEFTKSYMNTLDVTRPTKFDVLAVSGYQAVATHLPPTRHICHPADVYSMKLEKTTENKYKNVSNPDNPSQIAPFGIPVEESFLMTQDQFFTIPTPFCTIVMSRDWETGISNQDKDNYRKLMSTIRIFGRFGFHQYYPGSQVRGTFSSALS